MVKILLSDVAVIIFGGCDLIDVTKEIQVEFGTFILILHSVKRNLMNAFWFFFRCSQVVSSETARVRLRYRITTLYWARFDMNVKTRVVVSTTVTWLSVSSLYSLDVRKSTAVDHNSMNCTLSSNLCRRRKRNRSLKKVDLNEHSFFPIFFQ